MLCYVRRAPATMTTTETQTQLSGNLILDDPETADAETQTLEDESDFIWTVHAETQALDDPETADAETQTLEDESDFIWTVHAETQALDDPETADAETQTLEDESDFIWTVHAETQKLQEGDLMLDGAESDAKCPASLLPALPKVDSCETLPDVQEIAMVAYGHRLPPVPYARGAGCLGVDSWDAGSCALSESFKAFLEIKILDPWTALTILASTARFLAVVVPRLATRYPLQVLHAAAMMLCTDWECDAECFSKLEEARFYHKLGLHGKGCDNEFEAPEQNA